MSEPEETAPSAMLMRRLRRFAGLLAIVHMFPAAGMVYLIVDEVVSEARLGSFSWGLLAFGLVVAGAPVAQLVFSKSGSRIGLVLASGLIVVVDSVFLYLARAFVPGLAALVFPVVLAQVAVVSGACLITSETTYATIYSRLRKIWSAVFR